MKSQLSWESEPPGLDHTNRVAQRIADEWRRVLHPLKVEYRKKVLAILGDAWEPIADIFEHYAPQTLGRLDGWRREILDHTDPGREAHLYWLECRDQMLGPNADLKNRLENLVGKLHRSADRGAVAKKRKGRRPAKESRHNRTAHEQVLLLVALMQHHRINDGEINWEPATQKDLERLTEWNQSKVSRMMRTLFGEKPMQVYRSHCKGRTIKGFLVKRDNGSHDVEACAPSDDE